MTNTPAHIDLADRAHTLRGLHRPGEPLVLVNAWDVASAVAVAAAGAPAIATSSNAVAASLGFTDDNSADPDVAFAAVARIAAAVTVPVTADLEAGYGLRADEFVERLVAAGAVGCNLEDSDHRRPGTLVDADANAVWLAAVRAAAGRAGVPLVVNARVDVLILADGTTPRAELLAEVVRRCRRYLEAGADCVYPIGLRDPGDAASVAADLGGPLNANLGPGVTVAQMAAAGVSRISTGAQLHREAMAHLTERAAGIFGG